MEKKRFFIVICRDFVPRGKFCNVFWGWQSGFLRLKEVEMRYKMAFFLYFSEKSGHKFIVSFGKILNRGNVKIFRTFMCFDKSVWTQFLYILHQQHI